MNRLLSHILVALLMLLSGPPVRATICLTVPTPPPPISECQPVIPYSWEYYCGQPPPLSISDCPSSQNMSQTGGGPQPAPQIPQPSADNRLQPPPPTQPPGSGQSPNQSIGDPISLTGEFVYTTLDIKLPGRGISFELFRTYRNRVRYLGPLGHKWTHSFDRRLYLIRRSEPSLPGESSRIEYHDGRLNVFSFRRSHAEGQDIVYEPEPGIGLSLIYRDSEKAYVLKDTSGYEYVFSGLDMVSMQANATSVSDSWRPLTAIRDKLGNQQSIIWATGDDGFRNPRVLMVIDTMGRIIRFNYVAVPSHDQTLSDTWALALLPWWPSLAGLIPTDPTSKQYFLTCIDFDGTCTHPLMRYAVHGNVNLQNFGELKWARDGKDSGNSYEYGPLHPSVPDYYVGNLVQGVCGSACKPELGGIGANICTQCEVYRTSDLEVCSESCQQRCSDSLGESQLCQIIHTGTSVIYSNDSQFAQACEQCVKHCAGLCTTPNFSSCQQRLQNIYPFCGQLGSDALCRFNCAGNFLPKDKEGRTRYAFGSVNDTDHNLTRIIDRRERQVLRNEYGGDAFQASFNRVTKQVIGQTESPANTIDLAYHPLDLEAEWSATGGLSIFGQKINVPVSAVDSSLADLSHFNPVHVCPRAPSHGWLPAEQRIGEAKEPQPARWATVVYMPGGIRKTYYLDGGERVLRYELATRSSHEAWVGYETTNYNYVTYPTGTNWSIQEPSGRRLCTFIGRALDLPELIVDLPAPGYPGVKDPRLIFRQYDSDYALVGEVIRQGADHSQLVLQRDSHTGRIQAIERELGQKSVRRVEYSYASPLDDTPAKIKRPDGSFISINSTDSGQIGRILIDAASIARVGTMYAYDWRGNPKTVVRVYGNVNQHTESNTFDPDNGLLISRKLSMRDNPVTRTTLFYYDIANNPQKIDAPDLVRTFDVDSTGRWTSFTDVPKDPLLTPRTVCRNYSIDGLLIGEVSGEGVLKTFSYDAANRLVGAQQGYGLAVAPTWAAKCAMNRIVANHPPSGVAQVFHATFLPGGFPSRFEDGEGVGVSYTTDGFGRIIREIHDNGSQIWRAYDAFDNQIWEARYGPGAPVDYGFPKTPWLSLESMTELERDGIGRLTAIRRWDFIPNQQVTTIPKRSTTFAYDDSKNRVQVTDERGNVANLAYDGADRLKEVRLQNGIIWRALWRQNGEVQIQRPGENGVGITQKIAFDGLGLLSQVIDGNGREVFKEEHDLFGRPVRQLSLSEGEQRFFYDPWGNVSASVTNIGPFDTGTMFVPAWNRYRYDRDGRVVSFIDGMGHTTTWNYNGGNQIDFKIDALGIKTAYTYTGLSGRLKGLKTVNKMLSNTWGSGQLRKQTLTDSAGSMVERTFSYDGQGRIKTATINGNFEFATRGSTVTLDFDSLGRLVRDKNSLFSLGVSHDFDIKNGRQSMSVDTATVVQQYDLIGRLSSVSLNGNPIASIQYPPGAYSLQRVSYANGVISTFERDAAGSETSLEVRQSTGGLLASVQTWYGFDAVPRARQIQRGAAAPLTDYFTVDAARRISREGIGTSVNVQAPANTVLSNSDAASALSASGTVARKLAIDKAENWVSVTDLGGASKLKFSDRGDNSYGAVNGKPIFYDANGNLRMLPSTGGVNGGIFKFNQFGQLTTAGATHYAYDALGRRISESSGADKRWILWDGDDIVGIGTDPTLPSTFVLRVGMGAGGSLALAGALGAGPIQYLHCTSDKSTLALSDAGGNPIEYYGYSAFGNTKVFDVDGSTQLATPPSGNRFMFQGQLNNLGTNSYLMGTREYLPALGRFMSPDPMGLAGGQNEYAFVTNRPLTFSDPLGLDTQANYPSQSQYPAGQSLAGPSAQPRPMPELNFSPPPYTPPPLPPMSLYPRGGSIGLPPTLTWREKLLLDNARDRAEIEGTRISFHRPTKFERVAQEINKAIATVAMAYTAGVSVTVAGPTLAASTSSSGYFALTDARIARNALVDDLAPLKGKAPATVTAGWNTRTGEVVARACGGGQCAEQHVVDALGGVQDEVRFSEAARPRTGAEVPVCPNCENSFGRDPFPAGTKFKNDR